MSRTKENCIYYFAKENAEMIQLCECTICKTFIYSGQKIILALKHKRYYICIKYQNTGALYSFWGMNKLQDMTDTDAIDIFKKEFKRQNITIDTINSYIEDPTKYLTKSDN